MAVDLSQGRPGLLLAVLPPNRPGPPDSSFDYPDGDLHMDYTHYEIPTEHVLTKPESTQCQKLASPRVSPRNPREDQYPLSPREYPGEVSLTEKLRSHLHNSHVASEKVQANGLDQALCQVMAEYNQTIVALADLTNQLPRRLQIGLIPDSAEKVSRTISKEKVSEQTITCESKASKTMIGTRDSNTSTTSSSVIESREFQLQPAWQVSPASPQSNFFMNKAASKTGTLTKSFETDDDDRLKAKGIWFYIMSSPTHPMRMGWEFLGLILVMYDLITIPIMIAFKPTIFGVTTFIDIFELIFWTLNIPVSLTTGFFSNGLVIMNPTLVLKSYMKSWFLLDVVTLVPDWMFFVFSFASVDRDKESSEESLVRFLRTLRFMRLTRLARMIKLGNAWNKMHDKIYSDRIGILFGVLKMVLLLMLVNHLNACLWFVIGSNSGTRSWIIVHKYSLDDVSWVYQYMVAYHWSLTLFTPASMNVQPQSLGERTFTVFVVLLGLVGFSSLVGRITGSMARLHALGEEKKEKFSLLRKFLKKNKVGQELCIRIRTYLENRWELQKDIQESHVKVLELLSENLKAELACAIQGPALTIHPIFFHVQLDAATTMRRLTLRSVSPMSMAPQDMMFNAGEEGTHMSMVTSGSLEYHKLSVKAVLPAVYANARHDWIAEPVLWVSDWHHLGDLKAVTFVEILLIIPSKFIEIVSRNVMAFKIVSNYAIKYVDWLNTHDRAALSDVTKGEDVEELRLLTDAPKRPTTRRSSFHSYTGARSWGK